MQYATLLISYYATLHNFKCYEYFKKNLIGGGGDVSLQCTHILFCFVSLERLKVLNIALDPARKPVSFYHPVMSWTSNASAALKYHVVVSALQHSPRGLKLCNGLQHYFGNVAMWIPCTVKLQFPFVSTNRKCRNSFSGRLTFYCTCSDFKETYGHVLVMHISPPQTYT